MDLLVIVMAYGPEKGHWGNGSDFCLNRKLGNDLHPIMNNATQTLFLI